MSHLIKLVSKGWNVEDRIGPMMIASRVVKLSVTASPTVPPLYYYCASRLISDVDLETSRLDVIAMARESCYEDIYQQIVADELIKSATT